MNIRSRRVTAYAAFGVGVVVLVAGLLGAALLGWQAGRVLPNTHVAGIDVSRMSPEEAAESLREVARMRRTDPVVFRFEDERHELDPASVDHRVDVDATVAAMMARGRGGQPGDLVERVRLWGAPTEVDLVTVYDEPSVQATVAAIAASVDREDSPGSVSVDPATLEVTVEPSAGRATVRRQQTADAIVAGLRQPGPVEIDLPVDTEPARVADADVAAAAAQVERAVAAPMELGADEEVLALEPSQIAQLIEVVPHPTAEGATLELTVDPDRLEGLLADEDLARFARDPVDASYSVGRAPPQTFEEPGSGSFSPVEADVEVVDGQDGTRFDAGLAADRITELLREGARGGALPLEVTPPAFSTRQAEAARPTHLLGTFTTFHPAGDARVHNIQRLADVVDDTLMLPGERFSINEISGARSCDQGYLPAGTIVQGELVDSCGGGISQFGTTTFNAAFFAGLQLDQWRAHSWYISRYPMGREATLYFPVLDVAFTNTTSGAVIVRTSYTPTSITVSLYGQPIADRVSARHGAPFDQRAHDTRRRATSALCHGEQSVAQAGLDGFSIDVTRVIELHDGGEDAHSFRTRYVPRTRILDVGTRDCGSSAT